MSRHVRRSLVNQSSSFTSRSNCSNFLESLNTMTNSIPCFSLKMLCDLIISHLGIIFDQKLVFLRHPRKMFLFAVNRPKVTRFSLIPRNHSLPFSLHHKTFSVFFQKLGNAIRHMYRKAERSHVSTVYTCFYSYFTKSIGDLVKPFSFSRGNFITECSFSITQHSAVCRKQPCKPNHSFPKFLLACQSSHQNKLSYFINLNVGGW